MVEPVVAWIVNAAGAYLAFGVVASILLHVRGLRAMDHGAVGAPVLFRALITPGMIALWPIMLAKWRKAVRGETSSNKPDAPVRAATLRRIHGVAVRGMAVLLPIAVGVAVVAREPVAISATAGPLQDATPLPRIASETPEAFGDLPITLRVREGESHAWQVELDVASDLERSALGLYWTDGFTDGLSAGSGIYLGSVWGPGPRRFALPEEAIIKGGLLLIYSFIDADVVARAPVKAQSQL